MPLNIFVAINRCAYLFLILFRPSYHNSSFILFYINVICYCLYNIVTITVTNKFILILFNILVLHSILSHYFQFWHKRPSLNILNLLNHLIYANTTFIHNQPFICSIIIPFIIIIIIFYHEMIIPFPFH